MCGVHPAGSVLRTGAEPFEAEPFKPWGGFSCNLAKEIAMAAPRTFSMLLLAASISLSAVALMTQGASAAETQPAQQDTHSEGTAPHNMGSTGWTGGTGGSHVGKGET